MFDTSETTEGMEESAWRKNLLWFAAGCVVTILISYLFVIPAAKRAAADAAAKSAQQKFSAELEKNPLSAQLESTKAALQSATQERETCKAKFDRQTILYDNSIAVEPERLWIIPADVEPVALGDRPLTYTHYDLKTKSESAHFHPSRQ